MGFKEWIIPQDRVFYDLLEQAADYAQRAVDHFGQTVENWGDLEARRQELKALENQADQVSHEIFDRLSRTFITPLDREDITELTHRLDDVVDYIDAAGNRLALYEVPNATEAMRKFVTILKAQMSQLVPAVKSLRKPGERKSIPQRAIEVHRLENEADRLLNRSIAELFQTQDAVAIIKHKDIYESLEIATDRCEDVADVLNDIVRKQG